MTEHDFQCNIVRTLRMQNIFCFAIPNSQKFMSPIQNIIFKVKNLLRKIRIRIPFNINEAQEFFKIMSGLKKEGFLNGVADLIVLYKGKCYFVEIKTPAEYKVSEKTGKRIIAKAGGTQSEEQKKFQQEVEKEGFPYVLIDSWKKFEEFLSEVKK